MERPDCTGPRMAGIRTSSSCSYSAAHRWTPKTNDSTAHPWDGRYTVGAIHRLKRSAATTTKWWRFWSQPERRWMPIGSLMPIERRHSLKDYGLTSAWRQRLESRRLLDVAWPTGYGGSGR